jgi:uncharacterized protein YihD (DUF1040 family)
MKDPKRIKRICKLLEKQWSKVPDQRLGQFIANYIFGHHTDTFYQEDTTSEECLNKLSL